MNLGALGSSPSWWFLTLLTRTELPWVYVRGRAVHGHGQSALVFTSPEGERLRNSNWKRWVGWSQAVDTLGGRIRFHDLRHTCASMLIQAGATPVEVQRILGHSTPATTLNLYTHLLPDALDGAAAKLDGYLGGRP